MPATTVHRRRLVELEVELSVQWIMALLRVDAQRAPFTVQQVEQRERLDFAGMQLNIQMDRVDELSNGGWLLVDYKTGNSNHVKDWLDINVAGRPRSPQLPLYALAHRQRLAGISYAVLSPSESVYRGLARQADIGDGIEDYAQRKPRAKVPGVDDWNALLAHWQSVLNSLAHHYMTGDARVDPLKGECEYCHLASLCRINELREQLDDEEEGSDA
jgi:ATP-dependent helicase/DNAse subunit B